MMQTKKILVINDNHFEKTKMGYQFKGSKFHLFISGFKKSSIYLSSPSCDYENIIKETEYIDIDGVKVLPRLGYGSAIFFYKRIPFSIIKHFQILKKHISRADTVLLVAPACTLPISYFICRLLKKPLALYIVGDVIEVVRQNKSNSLINFLKLQATKWEWFTTKYISKRHTTFTLGSSTYNKLLPSALNLKFAMTSLVANNNIRFPVKKVLNTPIQILTVSRLSKEKGLYISLEAISNINNKVPIIYTIVGDGPERKSLTDFAYQLGFNSENIKFTGYLEQSKIREYYLDTDIFILPSLSEGIPKVILDAMAVATPIISTKVGGIPDLLSEDSSRGWLIEPNDRGGIESALQECIDSPEMRYLKIQNANKFIREHTTEKEAARIEAVLLDLAKNLN